MKFHVTDHAVQRYVDRIRPGLTFQKAKAELLAALPRATRIKERTVRGHTLWKVESPNMRLITKRDTKQHIIVTILPPAETSQDAGTLELLDPALVEEILQERKEHAQTLKERNETENNPQEQP